MFRLEIQRKPEYRIKTVMTDSQVYKNLFKKAEDHISQIKRKRYRNFGKIKYLYVR